MFNIITGDLTEERKGLLTFVEMLEYLVCNSFFKGGQGLALQKGEKDMEIVMGTIMIVNQVIIKIMDL